MASIAINEAIHGGLILIDVDYKNDVPEMVVDHVIPLTLIKAVFPVALKP